MYKSGTISRNHIRKQYKITLSNWENCIWNHAYKKMRTQDKEKKGKPGKNATHKVCTNKVETQ